MPRTLVVHATNLLARGFLTVPTDRTSSAAKPTNALFAVARALERKVPDVAVAVLDLGADGSSWPEILRQQSDPSSELETASKIAVEAMRGAYELKVPLRVGIEASPSWAELEPFTLCSESP